MDMSDDGGTDPSHEHEELQDWELSGAPEATLGGYFREHRRPPGFEGVDGEPYTVSLELEKTPNLAAPHEGYLVFLRWAATGLGVVGHLESSTLCRGRSREAVLEELGGLPLFRVKELLDEAIVRRQRGPGGPASAPDPPPT